MTADSPQSDDPSGAVEPLAAGDRWPDPRPEQVEVLLLGCYHMDNPGQDVVNVEADDVLSEERQAELAALADRLVEFSPDLVAVERPAAAAETVNEQYEAYAAGERRYDEAGSGDSTQPGHGASEARSEVLQVGFRLADRLGHDRVAPVDDHVDLEERFDDETLADLDSGLYRVPEERRERYGLRDAEAVEREQSQRLAESTIPEYLAWLNREEALTFNHQGMFAAAIPENGTRPPVGPTALGTWFERNLRTVHHLWRAADRDGADRVLLVVGSGHVRVLRYLLAETPMCCPVSPRPYLP